MNLSTYTIYFCKENKNDNFCYRKVGSAITKWGATEKIKKLLSQNWKNEHFDRIPKIISHFEGTNNIIIYLVFYLTQGFNVEKIL